MRIITTITTYLFIVLIPFTLFATKKTINNIILPGAKIVNLDVSISWGQIKIAPNYDNDSIKILVEYDNSEKKQLREGVLRLDVNENENTVFISSPKPKSGVFESYDLTIKIPKKLNLRIKMKRGGDIRIDDIEGNIEIENQNGSTWVNGAVSWVTVNNFNGEIEVSHKNIKDVKAVSLITFNGGIKLKMPNSSNADVVLQTKKNGSIRSEFPIISADGEEYSNMSLAQYPQTSSQWIGRVANGGAKIIAITNNGPIELTKSK